MDKDDDVDCAAECNYVVRRESRTLPDGSAMTEDVERCTGCGRVISRTAVPAAGNHSP
jgi:hypothetical protein